MKTYVVILNWNGWRDTVECLNSLLPVMGQDDAVVVCDNGSTDDSCNQLRDWVSARYPSWGPLFLTREEVMGGFVPESRRVFLVDNGANLGFAGGNNSGMQLAMNDPECRYVWLLNNDTTVDAMSLPAASSRMDADSSIGICGSTLMYFHEIDSVQALGGAVYSRWTGRSRHIGAFLSSARIPETPGEVEAQMSYVVGASMLVRREFIEQVGYMREDYFLYCEEIDWATRGQGKFRLGYAPQSRVLHKEGASIGTAASGGSPLSMFYLFRNRVRYAWRFHPAFIPSILFYCAIDIAKLLARRRWPLALAAMCGVVQMERLRLA